LSPPVCELLPLLLLLLQVLDLHAAVPTATVPEHLLLLLLCSCRAHRLLLLLLLL
jgi:hypothetical protein